MHNLELLEDATHRDDIHLAPRMQPRVEAKWRGERRVARGAVCAALFAYMRVGFERVTTHGAAAQHPTLPKCQRTVNFPPDSKLQASPPPCDYITFHSAGQWPRGRSGPAHRARAVQSGPRGASSCVSWLARGSRRPRPPLGRARAIFRALYKRAGALSTSSLLTETRKWSSVRVSGGPVWPTTDAFD